MEIKQLYPAVLILVMIGILLAIGIMVHDEFSQATYNDRTVTNESIAIASGTGTVNHSRITSITYFGNSTRNTEANASISITNKSEINYTQPTTIEVNQNNFPDNNNYEISYTYEENSTASTTMLNMISAESPIASTWLPLVVTVMALAIIMVLVITAFARHARR